MQSAGSYGRALSAFSNALADAVKACNRPKSFRQTPVLKKLRETKATAKSSKNKKIISSVLIKLSDEKSYAERVVRARAMQKGDVLIVLDRGSNKERFTAEVRRVVEGLDEVRAEPKKVTLEIHDHRRRSEGRAKEGTTK